MLSVCLLPQQIIAQARALPTCPAVGGHQRAEGRRRSFFPSLEWKEAGEEASLPSTPNRPGSLV